MQNMILITENVLEKIVWHAVAEIRFSFFKIYVAMFPDFHSKASCLTSKSYLRPQYTKTLWIILGMINECFCFV